MTPRTILILALGALVCVIAALTEPDRREATLRPVVGLKFGRDFATSSAPVAEQTTVDGVSVSRRSARVSTERPTLSESEAMQMANAHRTNRVLPGVRVSVNTNRFPLLEDEP